MYNSVKQQFQLQTAISRKRNEISYILWCQNSSLVEGFHLLFHESGLAPLFHPLSASFSQKTHFFGVFQVSVTVCLWSEYALGTPRDVGKQITRDPTTFFTV